MTRVTLFFYVSLFSLISEAPTRLRAHNRAIYFCLKISINASFPLVPWEPPIRGWWLLVSLCACVWREWKGNRKKREGEKLFRLCFLTLVPFPHHLSRVVFFFLCFFHPAFIQLCRIDNTRDRNTHVNLVIRKHPFLGTFPRYTRCDTPVSRRLVTKRLHTTGTVALEFDRNVAI